jgi:hypothetical protein
MREILVIFDDMSATIFFPENEGANTGFAPFIDFSLALWACFHSLPRIKGQRDQGFA